jgi:hypothetical protein
MATVALRDQLFTNKTFSFWVDGWLRLWSSVYDGETVVLKAVETLNFDNNEHFLYEWEISDEVWQNARVERNVITIEWEVGDPLILEVFVETPVNLEQ